MDAQQFMAAFGHVANAPKGIEKLREMVYQLAITGALIPQLSSDGDALDMLEDIKALRERLISNKAYKRLPKLESLSLDVPTALSLPTTWCWTRLLDIGEISPRNDAPDDAPASFIPMRGFSELHMGPLLAEDATWGEVKKGFTHFKNGDVVVAKITPCFENGKAAVIDGLKCSIGAGTTELQVFRPIHDGVLPAYIYLFLRSPYFAIEGEKNMTGTAGQKRLSTEYFATRALPLPPTAEQKRIVAKVDDLMALCDTLESHQQSRRSMQKALRRSTLQAVASATSPHELQITWTRAAVHFGKLFHAPEDVGAFKGMILDLAMSGQLLSVDKSEALSGHDLIEMIEAKRIRWSQSAAGQEKKEALTMLKKLRTQKLIEPESTLPEHWAWATLLQVSQAVVDCHNKTAPYVKDGIHLIRTTDIRNGKMDLRNTRKVSEETYAYWSRRMCPKSGDIFFTREAPMGEAALVPDGERVCLGQRSMLIRLFPELFSNRFLLYVIQSPGFQLRMAESAIGMTVKHLRVGGVEDLVIPVPPKAEQDRIVTILDSLFRICDHYAGQLSRKLRLASNLASSAIDSISGVQTNQNEESMKVPQTELIATLRLGQTPDVKEHAPLAHTLARHQGAMSAQDLRQRFPGEIDTFYAQLKTEVAHGWILEPAMAEMREVQAESSGA